MGQYMQSTVTKKYPCAFCCHHCGELNVSMGSVQAQHRTSYGLIGTKKEDAKRISSENAAATAEKMLDKLVTRVNEKQDYSALNAPSVCKKCGKPQAWAQGKEEKYAMIGAAVLAIAVGIVLFVKEIMEIFPLLFFCFFVFAISFVTLGMLAVRIIRKIRAGKAKEIISSSAYSHCAPMISKLDYVQGDLNDPRAEALNALAAAREKLNAEKQAAAQ